MSGVLASNFNGRQIVDSNLSNATALGTAASTVQSAAFDTGDNRDGILPEEMVLSISVPATPNLISAAVITFTVLADTAATPTLALFPSLTFTVAGTSGSGGLATTAIFKLPANCARYVAVQALAGTSGAGNNSAVSYTSQLQF